MRRQKMDSDEKKPFLSHLEELRKRLISCAIAVGVGFFFAYFFAEKLFRVLVFPLKSVMPEGDRLIFTGLPDMFFTYLKVAFITGIMVTAPFLFYQIWMFVAPGLYQREKKLVIPFVVCSTILFVGGSLFGYFIVFPFGFRFFLSFSNELVQALPSVKQYFSFSIKLLFAFGVVFELPVVIFFLTKMGLLTPAFMKKYRRHSIVVILIIAAIVTPSPDFITQGMLAVPMLLLYEISIYVSKVTIRRREAALAAALEEDSSS